MISTIRSCEGAYGVILAELRRLAHFYVRCSNEIRAWDLRLIAGALSVAHYDPARAVGILGSVRRSYVEDCVQAALVKLQRQGRSAA